MRILVVIGKGNVGKIQQKKTGKKDGLAPSSEVGSKSEVLRFPPNLNERKRLLPQ